MVQRSTEYAEDYVARVERNIDWLLSEIERTNHLVRLQAVVADEYCLARHQYRHNDGAQWNQASAADISLAERRLRGVE